MQGEVLVAEEEETVPVRDQVVNVYAQIVVQKPHIGLGFHVTRKPAPSVEPE